MRVNQPPPQKRSCSYKKTTKTLDSCHKTNLESFARRLESRDEIEKELHDVNLKINIINEKNTKDRNDEDFINIVNLTERKKELNELLSDIDTAKKEQKYFVDTSDILYNYYNLVENNCDKNMQPNTCKSKKEGSKSILDYFNAGTENLQNETNDNAEEPLHEVDAPLMITRTSLTQSTSFETNRAALLDQFLYFTDKNYINNNLDNTAALKCDHCQSVRKTILYNDSMSFCDDCFSIQHLLTDNEKPSYKDPPKEISYFSYKRINHYQEWLNQIQGKETTDIPDEVFDSILLELRKQRIYNVKELNRGKIKEILKKLKINKYYEHIPYIMNRITGIPNPSLTHELEETLRNMFKEIQVPFLKHSPLNRKNFLSYSYVIHKFIQLLGRDEYLKYFPLLKSRDKLHQQEQIWRNICKDLGWKFIRSI